jgi:hypothetical protein
VSSAPERRASPLPLAILCTAEASDGKHRIQLATGVGGTESIERTILGDLIRRV